MNVRRLTRNQALVLLEILDGAAFSKKHWELGGVLSALTRNGIIKPLGRNGRGFNWEIVQELTANDIKILKRICQ